MSLNGMSLELGYLIKEVQQDIRKKMDKCLQSINLTTPQYSVLAELQEFSGLSNADLSRKSFVTPQTMNLIVQKLEERKLINRTDSKTHGKIMNTEITSEGIELLTKAHKIVIDVQQGIFGGLSSEESATLSVILMKLRKMKTSA
jgi:DNA-binding MarR family transcriptional regulator